jgi:hypothetical protein
MEAFQGSKPAFHAKVANIGQASARRQIADRLSQAVEMAGMFDGMTESLKLWGAPKGFVDGEVPTLVGALRQFLKLWR